MHLLDSWRILFPLLYVLFFLQGCKKDCDDLLKEPIIGLSEPISEGEELILIARGDVDNMYNWTGPNGFTAKGKSISLGMALSNMSGEYAVEAIQGDCRLISRKTIEIELKEPLCDPEVNTISFDKFPGIKDDSPECGYDSLRNSFTFKAASINGALYVVFPSVNMPEFDRAYEFNIHADSLAENQVFLQVFTGKQPNLKPYTAANGDIFFRKREGALELSFCDILCTYLEQSTVLSGRLICVP